MLGILAGGAGAGGSIGATVGSEEQKAAAADAQAKAQKDIDLAKERQEAAEATQTEAARSAAEEAQTQLGQQFAQARADLGRAVETVAGGRSRVAELFEGGIQGFEASPGFQFAQQQGEQAIARGAAARGGRMSGRTLQELGQFNTGLAQQEFQNFANRQIGLAGGADQAEAARLSRVAQLLGGQSGLAAQLGGAQAGISTGLGQQLVDISQRGTADQLGMLGSQMALRFAPVQFAGETARNIGNAVSSGNQAILDTAETVASMMPVG